MTLTKTLVVEPLAQGGRCLRIVRAAYGSHPWYAIVDPMDGTVPEAHPSTAVWIQAEPQGTTISDHVSDGRIRFFRQKRQLLRALTGSEEE